MGTSTFKRTILRTATALSVILVIFACNKELSVENGGFGNAAQGTLTDSSGSCSGILVNGNYYVDTTVSDSNYLKVNINFTTQGKYLISSDTVNGLWFLDSGFALNTGAQVVKVKAKGKPLLAKTSLYTLSFGGTTCSFSVTIGTGTGSGGTGTTSGSSGDYFPTTSGSTWTYQYLPKLGTIDTFKVTAAVAQVTLDSLTYSQFGTSLGDTFYFAKNASIGNYYALSTVDFDYTFLFDSIPSYFITYPFLKENAAVGETWESGEYGQVKLVTGSTTEYGKAKAVFTIITKNTATYTIGGKVYDNVINVKREIKFIPNGGAYRSLLTGNSYYAKGYGLIDQVINTSPTQSVSLYRTPTIVR